MRAFGGLTRSTTKVFLSLLFTAVCQFGYGFKWLLSTVKRELIVFIAQIPDRIREWPEPSEMVRFLFTWQNLRRLVPTFRTLGIYLLTFGIILPLYSTTVGYTLYQRAFNSARYYDRSDLIRRIVKGPNMTQQIVDENVERLWRSINVLDRVMIDYQSITQELRSPGYKDVVIGIITYSRDKYREPDDNDPRQYLTQLTASLVDKYHQYRQVRIAKPMHAPFKERSLSVSLLLCNVDEDPDSHQEFRWLSNRLKIGSVSRKDKVTYMNSCEDPSRKVTGMSPWGPFDYTSRFEKQKQDYTFCLRFFQDQMMSRYLLVLEDDVIPVKDFFFRLHELVFNRLDRNEYGSSLARRRHDSFFFSPPVFMVKLHHPEVFLSYVSLATERLPQLIAMACLFSYLFIVLRQIPAMLWLYLRSNSFTQAYRTVKRTSPVPIGNSEEKSDPSPAQMNRETHGKTNGPDCSIFYIIADSIFARPLDWFVFAKWFLYFSLVFLAMGRPNTYLPLISLLSQTLTAFPHYFMTLTPAPSCCVTAVLYPKKSVDDVVRFFEENRCIQNSEARDDMLFGQLSESHRYPSYLTEPNLFYHIGRYSSIRGRVNTNDFREWAGIPF